MPLSFLVSDAHARQIGRPALASLQETYALHYPEEAFLVEISLVSPEEISNLNKTYRALDEATDVLSFPTFSYQETLHEAARVHPALLGSIVICPEKVAVYQETLPQMVHHGILHLLGYDHETNPSSWKEQEESILDELSKQSLTIPAVPYEPIQLP